MNMIKKSGIAAAVAASTLLMSAGALAVDGTGTASAEVLAPISISENTPMNFGYFMPSTTAGTVDLTTAGVRSVTGGVVLVTGGGEAAGVFDISGAANATYAVTVPSTITLTNTTDGTSTMVITTTNVTGSGTATLSAAGADTVTVAGNLAVGANQVVGVYSSNYTVTVDYN